jgi:hypothetical protein
MADDCTPSAELEELVQQVRRLRPEWRDADSFYERRSEIAGALLRLSRRLVGKAMPAPPAPMRPHPVAAVVRCGARVVVAAPPPARPRAWLRRHRYSRPPTLPAAAQPTLNLGG